MKKQLTAMILAASAAFMGVSFGVFADVAPPPQPTTVNIGKGNISITPTQITYYKDSGNAVVPVTELVNTAGYVITGTHTMQANGVPTTLQITDARVPLTLAPTQQPGQPATAFTVSGNLSTNAPLTFNGAVNVTGNLEAKSVLLENGAHSAVPVVFNGPVGVGGNLVADQTLTAYGAGTTTVWGDMTVAGQLTAQGPLVVKKNLTLSTAPQLQGTTVDGNLFVNSGDFTITAPLIVGGALQAKAGNLTINTNTSAGSIYASGNLAINAQTTAGSLVSGTNMALNVATNTGSISAGAALTSGSVPVQTTSGGITAKNAIDLAGPVTAAGTITSTAGNVTLRNSATASGAITGVNVELKGVTNAAAISATGGNLTADASVTASGDMQAAGSLLFRQTAKAGGNIRAQGAGTVTFNSVADAGQTIASAQGSIYAQGDVRAWAVQASNGTVDLRGNVTAQNSILAGAALNIAGTVDTELISAAGAVTLGGNTTAMAGVKGASVMVNNSAWLKTPNLNTPVTATNRFAVDVNTPFSAGTAVTVKATGVNAMPTTLGATRSTGLRLWLPAGRSTITVQDASRSYLGNVQVQASATPSYLTLSNNSSSAGGGGGGVGGSDTFDEDEFWDDVADRIKSARSGDEIRLSAAKVDNMPVWVLRELDGRNVTLRVSHGSVTVALNGKKLPSIPANKVFYNFDDLKEWYVDGQKPEPSSSSQTSSAKPSTPLPPASSSTPQVVAPPASSVAPPKPSSSSSSSSEESSSALEEPSSSEESSSDDEVIADAEEDKTPPEPEKTKRPVLPLVIAGVVASLAAAGAVVGYLLYRRKTEEYLDDDKKDPPELPM